MSIAIGPPTSFDNLGSLDPLALLIEIDLLDPFDLFDLYGLPNLHDVLFGILLRSPDRAARSGHSDDMIGHCQKTLIMDDHNGR